MAGGVVVVVAVVLVLIFTVFKGGGKDDTSSPKGVVNSFLNAAKDGDAGAAKKLVCSSQKSTVDEFTDGSESADRPASWKFGNVDEHGSSAAVPVDLEAKSGDSQSITFNTMKEDGDWKICGVNGVGFDGNQLSDASSGGSDSGSNGSTSRSGSAGSGDSASGGIAVAPAGTASPKSVVNAFLNAAKKHDTAAARKLVCASMQGNITDFGSGAGERLQNWKIGDVEQHGDQASVPVDMTSNEGSTASLVFETSKENGKWLVCGLGLPRSDRGSPPSASYGN